MANSEYFADKRLKKVASPEDLEQCRRGFHKWSNWFSVPAGLARECLFCHQIQHHPKYDILAKADVEADEILEDLNVKHN